MGSTNRSPIPDYVRGVAALLVCASHARVVVVGPYSSELGSDFLTQAFFLVTGLGEESVIIFFALSGYLIGTSIFSQRHSFVWVEYLSSRLARLLTVLVPALALTLASDSLTSRIDPRILEGAYVGLWRSGPTATSFDLGILAFIGNLFFLQDIIVEPYGSNGPLWSLAYEFWYYIIFPLLLTSMGTIRTNGAHRIASGILLAMLLGAIYWLCPNLIHLLPIWLIGASVGIAGSILGWRPVATVPALLLVLTLVLSKASKGTGFEYFCFVLLALFGSLLFHAEFSSEKAPLYRSLTARVFGHIGKISFSLYLVHFPLILLIAASGILNLGYTLRSVLLLLTIIACIVAFAHYFWRAFESRTPYIRGRIHRLFVQVSGGRCVR